MSGVFGYTTPLATNSPAVVVALLELFLLVKKEALLKHWIP